MIIYKTTNLLNDKIYIGKDYYNKPTYYGSGVLLLKAIKKYGKLNFKKKILEECNTKEELNKREIYWINYYNSRNKTIGYNIALGGDGQKAGTKLSQLTKNKISKSQTLIGYIEKYGEEEGIIKYTNKIKNLSKCQQKRFKKRKERIKISKSVSGEKNGMYGKTHSIDTINKMKTKLKKKNKSLKEKKEISRKLSIKNSGEKNGMFNKGYLIKGEKNGKAKTWKLIDNNKKEYIVKCLIQFTNNHNLSIELLRRFKNNIIPKDLKIRKSKSEIFENKINTLGWQIYEVIS